MQQAYTITTATVREKATQSRIKRENRKYCALSGNGKAIRIFTSAAKRCLYHRGGPFCLQMVRTGQTGSSQETHLNSLTPPLSEEYLILVVILTNAH